MGAGASCGVREDDEEVIKMKKWIAILLTVAFASLSQAQTLIDAWYYDGVPNGTLLNGANCGSVSNINVGTYKWKHNGTPAVVFDTMQKWEGDYVAGVTEGGSAFKNITPSSSANATGGNFVWQYEVTSADFGNTADSNGTANILYAVRGKSGAGAYDCGLRMRYEGRLNVTNIYNGVTNAVGNGDADHIQVQVRTADLGNWTTVTNFAGSSINDLLLKMAYDIDAKTNGAYISIGGGSEVLIHSGTMQSDWTLAQLRQGFQSGNGNNSWQPGDVVVIGDIELFELAPPPPPPATAVVDVWHYEGLTNGAGINQAASTGYVGGVSFSAATPASITNLINGAVTNGVLKFTSNELEEESLFRTAAPSLYGGSATGVFEVAYDILSIDFSETSLVSSNGQFGLEIRDSSNNRMGLHVQYNGTADEITLEFEDAGGKTDGLVIPGHVASNLTLRMLMDLDDAGNSGSAQFFYTYEGVEVAKYDGTVHSGYDFAQYRLRCQPINGGNGWKIGDETLLDNMRIEKVSALEVPPEYAEKVVYEMNDTVGTLLNALDQTGTDGGQFQGTDAHIVTDGSGSLVFTGDTTNDVTRKHFLDVAYTNGLHRLEFALDDFNIDASGQGSSLKYGFADSTGSNLVQFGIDVNTNNATARFRASANNGGDSGQDFYDYGYVASTGVVLRIDINLDAGTYGASWRYDNETEFKNAVGGGSLGGLADIAEIRLVVNAEATIGFDAADYINTDYLKYSSTAFEPTVQDYFNAWLADYPGLGASTNLTDDPDLDLLDNLGEYAFGGDPTDGNDRGYVPAAGDTVDVGGTNYILHVYQRRQDSAIRGLSHWIELDDNLVIAPAFTNDTSLYTFHGAVNVDDTWRSITNRVNAEGGVRFINTKANLTE